MKFHRIAWITSISLFVMLTAFVVFAQAPYPAHLIATGGGFNQQSDPFFNALSSRAAQFDLPAVQILVLPIGIGSNPNSITDAERKAQLTTAEQQRQEIETNCQAFMPQAVNCTAMLIPVITRPDAQSTPALKEFSPNPDAIVFLQNNAKRILEIVLETDLAGEIASAYQAGTILSGPGDLFSNTFIHGYRPKFGASTVLTFGAVLAGEAPEKGGLEIFPRQALVDTLPFSANHFGRMIASITGPTDPHIGIGVEANTGFELREQREMLGFYGDSVVAILDAETYQSANSIIYQAGTQLIGLRNLLLHLVSPGAVIYNLEQRTSSVGSIPSRFVRSFDDLRLPTGAGSLMLTSNLLAEAAGKERLIEFTNLSGGHNARLLVLAAGFPDLRSAEQAGAEIGNLLEVPSDLLVISPDTQAAIEIPSEITGIILTGPDPASIHPDALLDIKSSWLSGLPILADRAGASILGQHFSSLPNPAEGLQPFSPGRYQLQPGLGFIQANIDPLALTDHSWERSFTSAILFPETLSIGIAPGAALKIDSQTVEILGDNVVTLADFRNATITTGNTGVFAVANGLLDIYTPGEQILPLVADIAAAPIHAPTPELAATSLPPGPTPTQTIVEAAAQPEPTDVPRGKPPTRTPRPTGTPVPTPPPSDPGTTNLMVFFGVLSVVVVIVGVWLNRGLQELP